MVIHPPSFGFKQQQRKGEGQKESDDAHAGGQGIVAGTVAGSVHKIDEGRGGTGGTALGKNQDGTACHHGLNHVGAHDIKHGRGNKRQLDFKQNGCIARAFQLSAFNDFVGNCLKGGQKKQKVEGNAHPYGKNQNGRHGVVPVCEPADIKVQGIIDISDGGIKKHFENQCDAGHGDGHGQGEGGLRQWEVMKSGMGARSEPIMLAITTSGYQNDSIYDELVKRSTRFLLGESKETRLLPFLYMIDDVDKWNDINELQKANPNLGVSISVDYLLEEIAIAEGSLSKAVEFKTKYACIKQNASSAWLSTETISKCLGDEITLDSLSHNYAVAGLDLSQTTDLTSACVIVEKDGVLNVVAKFWLPSQRIDEASERDGVPYRLFIERGLLEPSGDNYVDYKDCYRWLCDLVEQYQILPLVCGYDRYSAQYLIQDLQAFGFTCDDVYQGDNLWGVMQEAEGMMKDGKINIGDNDLLKMHFLNSAVKMSTERGRGKLVKISPTAHIDGMAAFLDAMTVRQKHYATYGEQLKNKR